MSDYYEREEDALWKSFERGEITRAQLNSELRALRQDYRADAEEAADRARDREMDRW